VHKVESERQEPKVEQVSEVENGDGEQEGDWRMEMEKKKVDSRD